MRYGITPGPTRADADALVALPKFIRRMPMVRERDGTRRIKSARIFDSSGRQIGLWIDAHVSEPPKPGDTISVALVWRGKPIRRIDWKASETFHDGLTVQGWHEHLWGDDEEDRVGRPFKPPLDGWSDLKTMFVTACQHWNITILTRQDRPLRLVSDDDERD